jgi:hypothetical protein
MKWKSGQIRDPEISKRVIEFGEVADSAKMNSRLPLP